MLILHLRAGILGSWLFFGGRIVIAFGMSVCEFGFCLLVSSRVGRKGLVFLQGQDITQVAEHMPGTCPP